MTNSPAKKLFAKAKPPVAPFATMELGRPVNAIAVSPNGRRVIVGLDDGTLELWDLNLCEKWVKKRFEGHQAKVWSVAFNPEGTKIVSGSKDKTIRLWNLSGEEIQTFQGHQNSVLSVVFNPKGTQIVSGSDDSTIRLWNLSGEEIQTFQGHQDRVLSVAFNPEGTQIVSGSDDKTIRLWNLKGQLIQTFQGHQNSVWSVAFNPEGTQIVSGSADKTIRLWNLSGEEIQTFQGHQDRVLSVAFNPEGTQIVSGSDDKTIRLWNLKGQLIQTFQGHQGRVWSVAFNPEGTQIVSGGKDSTIRLWNLKGQVIQTFQRHRDRVWSVAFNPEGTQIVSDSEDSTIRLWNLSGEEIQRFAGHQDRVLSVAFNPEGTQIVSGSHDNTIRLWNLSGEEIQTFQGHQGSVLSVTFNSEGTQIVSSSLDNTIRLWNLSGEEIQTFQGFRDSVRSVTFNPEGTQIVSSSDDNTIRLWNLSGEEIQRFAGHQGSVLSVSFNSEGTQIVSGSDDSTIRLWNLSGEEIQTFQGHRNRVWLVAFNPEGTQIVSGSHDNTIRLWNVQDPKQNLVIDDLDLGAIYTVAIDPRGDYILVGGEKGIRLLRYPQLGVRYAPQPFQNDQPGGEDRLAVAKELYALTDVLMMRSLEPPIAVAILGSWGSGKSFGMHLLQQRITEIRCQKLEKKQAWGTGNEADDAVLSPYVGHIYQINFDAWTYAKSDLWASLMQTIFFELNQQISLEQQLGRILSHPSSKHKETSERYITRFIYHPLSKIGSSFLKISRIFFEKLTTSVHGFLNLWLIQLVLHILIFIFMSISMISISFVLLMLLFSLLIERTFDSRLKNFDLLDLFFDLFINLGEQFRKYYFSSDLETSFDSWHKGAESIIEHILFFLFGGFPKRLKDRQKQAEERQKTKSDRLAEQKFQDSNQESDPFGQALREAGEFWRVLYWMKEEDRNEFLKRELSADQFQNWKKQRSNPEIMDYLWKTLDRIKQEEKQALETKEKELQEKEKELQRELKKAEIGVKHQLSQKTIAAFWKPVIHAIARLRFSSQEIEDFAAADQTWRLFRKTILSWQGLVALALMTWLIVLSLDEPTRTAIVQPIQTLLQNSDFANQISQWIPEWVKNTFISLQTNVANGIQNLPGWLKTVQETIPKGIQVFSAVTASVVAAIPILKAIGEYIKSVQKEQASIQGEEKVLLEQEKGKARELTQQIAELKVQVQEQRQRAGLTANYSSIIDFVNSRLDSSSYDNQLGLMQQVKQDLAALSDRLTSRDGQELQTCFPRGPARVVLYIDDLDRCPPQRVVEVLEAVQLLLKTQLFVVILAIDDRYIVRALESAYPGVLKRRGTPSGFDYLEKIIQIPYRMRTVSGKEQMVSYLKSQIGVLEEEFQAEQQAKYEAAAKTQRSSQRDLLLPDADINAEADAESHLEQLIAPTPTTNPDPETPPKPVQPTPPKPSSQAIEPDIWLTTIVRFTQAEFDLIQDCIKHVDLSPRTVKRIGNICKVLKLIWTPTQDSEESVWKTEPSSEVKQTTIAFLVLSARYPHFMRSVIDLLYTYFENPALLTPFSAVTTDEAGSYRIHKQPFLQELKAQEHCHDPYTQREFDRFEQDFLNMPPQPFLFERRTFNLILSFCFVGDLGYDPDDHSATQTAQLNEPTNGKTD